MERGWSSVGTYDFGLILEFDTFVAVVSLIHVRPLTEGRGRSGNGTAERLAAQTIASGTDRGA
jgi:hypothetical protein